MLIGHSKINWLYYAPIALCLLLALVDLQIAVSIAAMMLFVLWAALKARGEDRFLWNALIIAAVFRMLLTILNEFVTIFPPQSDSVLYNLQAMQIIENSARNLPVFYDSPHSQSVHSYSFFLALFYRWAGLMPLLTSTINIVLGLLTALLVYRLSLLIFENRRAANIALIMTLFFPTFIAFTTYVLRDALILFFTFLMLYTGMLAALGRSRIVNAAIALISFVLIGIYRVQNLYLYGAIGVGYLLLALFLSKRLKTIKWALLLVGVAVMVYVLIANRELVQLIINYPLRAQPLRAGGASVYLENMEYRSLFDLIRYLPLRFIYFTFGPFLWNVYSASMLLSALESLVVVATFILTVLYFRKKKVALHLSAQWFLLFFCLTCLLANALVDSNFGTSVRHRIPYVIFFFMFTGAYLRDVKFRLL
jgi:hypothetical protein